MTTIGFATLKVIPSVQGLSEEIEKQVRGKVLDVSVAPKVDQAAAEKAGQQVKNTVEKHTTQVKVQPKVDQPAADTAGRQTKEQVEKHTTQVKVQPKADEKAAQDAGKKTGDAVATGMRGSQSAVGGAIVGMLQGAGQDAGGRLGKLIADQIPKGLDGVAGKVAETLRKSLPVAGEAAGIALATAIGTKLTDAIGKERLDRAGIFVLTNLKKAVGAANTATDIGVSIGNSIAKGLGNARGAIQGAAGFISNSIGGITDGISSAKTLLGEDSWAAPGLDALNSGLEKASPLLTAMSSASQLAAAGQQAITTAVGLATKAQLLWNIALDANPIGLIVLAIGALVAGIIYFFTQTETGRALFAKFTEYMKVAWEAIKIAFSAAWDFIKPIWQGFIDKAGEVWDWVREKFTNMVDFVRELPGKIADGAKGMWNGIVSAFKSMINELISEWNFFADLLSFTVPDIPGVPGRGESFHPVPKIASLATGGYTGNGAADQIAGVVHGGEYVIKADSTAKIQNAMPGLLDYLNNSGALPGYAGGGLVAGAEQLRKIIAEKFGVSNIGGWRPADKYGEHSTGRALDVMTSDKAKGDSIKDFAVQNASAIDLKWVIWQQKLWYPGGGSQPMADRGSPTQNHMDHVHIFSGEGITNGLKGSLAQAQGPVQGAMSGPDPTGISAPDATGAGSADTGSSGGSQSMSVPGSLSGIAGMYGDMIGKIPAPVVSPDGKTESLDKIGSAAGQFATGQVSSALGAFGIGDSPGWLKGISTLASGISIGGGSKGGPLGGGGNPVAPISAGISPAVNAATGVASSVMGAPAPGGAQTTYNIQTATVEDAFLQSQRIEKERAAATLERY